MVKRTLTSLALFLVGFPLLLWGGLPYFLFIGFLLAAAANEYITMMRAKDHQTPRVLLMLLTTGLILARGFFAEYAGVYLALALMVLMAWHLMQFEAGREPASVDFAVSTSVLVYLGWVGTYLVTLRQLPDGGWWLMLSLFCVWMTDTGAYMIGSAYGKHKMAPRLSPHKSWEGFYAGLASAMLMGAFFAYAFGTWGPLRIAPWQGSVLGLLVGVLSPLGDLGKSMIKRYAGFKDSGNLIPGHGGAFDRIDSWIWAAVIGQLVVTYWFLA